MADFRKLVLALAVLALIAVPASAQQTVTQCSAFSGAGAPLVRAEGLTELVGDAVLTCFGAGATANIQVFLNTNVTNKITDAGTKALEGATLTVAGPDGSSTPYPGRLAAANSIVWTGVVIPAATTGTTAVVRLSDIRANATTVQTSSVFGFGGQIQEFISITSTAVGAAVSVFPSQVDVAVAVPGLTFAKGSDTLKTFQQCTGFLPEATAADKIPGGTLNTFTVKYTENIAAAFKKESAEGTGATTGTRLFLRFTSVPAGAVVYVTKVNTDTGATATATAGYATADPAVATGTPATTQGYQKVDLSGGTGTAVFEVTDSNNTLIETLTFGVVVSIPANIPFQGGISATAQVAGGFAPLASASAGVALTNGQTPRFVDKSTPSDLFNITACVTNLLFPYVTNAAGFDTGIAIVNTSKDTGVFDTTPQNGTCTVYYFGAMGNGSQVPGPQTTASIAGGEMTAFLLSQGGVSGATNSAASFTGYVIARCNFQYAHGFAFISDLGGSKLAQGYLALVIPDKTRTPDPFTGTNLGTGEQLGY